ncbi:MAG: PAS domain-containing protein [Planctomycetaceae bacterium]|nr:PAS domain-containing protein [Planctomycetales bacterium]MCB9923843.1 PAS domain-containing protein [Planctomycetaceae bacterium]
MLARSAKVELPRRVVVYYLLFSLVAFCWLAGSAVIVTKAIVVQRDEDELLSYLPYAATLTSIEADTGDEAKLQSLVGRFARERALRFCAFVARDNLYIAHSDRRQVGSPHQIDGGITTRHEDIEAVRHCCGGVKICEYSTPIQVGELAGRLIVARQEPSLGETFWIVTPYAPFVVCGPLLLLTLGGFTLHRLVNPLAAVDSQLRQAAMAPTLADVELKSIKSRGPSVLGWNRIVGRFHEESTNGSLDQRINQAVQSLRQGKSDDVLNSLTDGIAVCDQDGKMTFANQAMAAMFAGDAQAESLVGRELETCMGLDPNSDTCALLFDPDLFARHVVDELERGSGESKQILRIARAPLRTAEGLDGNGHVWTVRDITQQKLADAMRDQFLDNATHELRTPLANIKAYAETLSMDDMLDVESQKEFCNTINVEATRLARFIDDLLSVSSMEAGSLTLNKQGVDLQRLFEEVIGKIKPQMDKKDLEFETIFPAKYPQTRLDKDKVNVALVNLLGNAAKYTPDGGKVRFEVKITDRELRIEVEDSGVGISEQELPHIYDKFFRSANPAVQAITGTGLGLSMAYEVIKLHGGDMTVQSKLGEGTTFVATLPLE